MAVPNQIVIDSPTNTVEIQTNDNQLTIISEVCNTEVTVTQPTVTTIQVATPGPKGDKGDTGNTGTAITNQITTGSITASVDIGTNTFRVQSGSSTYFYISSSGNVGIGTTTPTNTLQVSGGITATSITASIISASSGITGSLFGTSSTTTGVAPAITGNTNDRVLTATGGQTINGESNLLFNGNTLGVVGDVVVTGVIDTATLSVSGYVDTNLSPTDATYNLTLGESSRTWNQVYVGTSDGAKTAFFGEDLANNPGRIVIGTGGDLTIRGQGGVTIEGTTNIATLQNDTLTNNLSISTPSLTATNLRATNSASIGGNFSPTARLHISGANNDTLLRVSSPTATNTLFVSGSGNVGIGTTNPLTRLHISGSTSGSILEPTSSGVPTFTGRDGQFIFGSSGGNHFIYVYMAGAWRSSSLS